MQSRLPSSANSAYVTYLSSAQSYILRKCLTEKKNSIISSLTGLFLYLSRNFCIYEKHFDSVSGNVPQSSTIIYSLSHCRFSDNRYLLHFSSDEASLYPYPSQHFALKKVLFTRTALYICLALSTRLCASSTRNI